jgi:hypothetical protein
MRSWLDLLSLGGGFVALATAVTNLLTAVFQRRETRRDLPASDPHASSTR